MLPSSRHAELANLACKNAIVRRDVAHLIFPDDVQTIAAGERGALGARRAGSHPTRSPRRPADLDRAVELLAGAKRPVIIAGYGARDAMEDVISLAERLGAPVITTFKAKGQIRDDHPLACGVLGRSGTPVASWVMNEADMLLVLGASFSNHTGIYAGHPIVQVDFDRMQLGKFHPVTVPVWGEVGDDLPADRARARAPWDGRHRPARRRRRPPGDLGRREGEPRGRRPRPRRQLGVGVRHAQPAGPRGRRDRGRRRQPRLLVRPLLRDQGIAAGADVGLPGLDRLRLPRRDGRLGGDRRRAPDRRRHRRRRLRPVHGRDH